MLKDEHKTAHQSSKFKLSHILILLLLVETSYIIFSHISTPSTVSIPTPSPVSITPTPRPQKSNADYWQEKLDALEVETTDKDSYYSPTFFINGELLVEPFSPCVCPLTVSVQGNDSYYVYMECLSNWNDDISFMIRANSTVDINVPEGSYEFYYATGEYWYGQVNKFGPDTQYYKADTILDFTSDNEYFYGHELELWTQAGGNMERTAIDESTFPG